MANVTEDDSRQVLEDSKFIRHQLFDERKNKLQRYADLVLAQPGTLSLINYEIANWMAVVPGAVGLLLRGIIFRRLFGQAGKGIVVGRSITIRHPERIALGDNVILDDYCLLDARGSGDQGVQLGDAVMVNRAVSIQAKVGAITVGANTTIGAGSQIISQGPIEIGANVSIAGGTMIAGGRYDVELQEENPEQKRRFTGGAISIGANARIGMRSIVLDGVSIGENAIVAPGSVVFDDVPPNTIVIGCPARPLRNRPRVGSAGHQADPTEAEAAIGPSTDGDAGPESIGAEFSTSQELDIEVFNAIKSYLEESHKVKFGSEGIGYDDSLFDHGVIDSVGLVGMLTELENRFDVLLDPEDLIPENLSTVTGLTRTIMRKIG